MEAAELLQQLELPALPPPRRGTERPGRAGTSSAGGSHGGSPQGGGVGGLAAEEVPSSGGPEGMVMIGEIKRDAGRVEGRQEMLRWR